MAYFNQARASTRIVGASGKYETLTGAEFLKKAVERNFAALAARRAAEVEAGTAAAAAGGSRAA